MTPADRDRVMAYTPERPWMRRERIDLSYRNIIAELEALIAADDAWSPFYRSLWEGCQAGLALINEIEDMVDESLRGGYSVKVPESTQGEGWAVK